MFETMLQSFSPVWLQGIFRHWSGRGTATGTSAISNTFYTCQGLHFCHLAVGPISLDSCLSPQKIFKTVSQSSYQAQSGCQRSSATGVAQAPPLTDTQPTSHVPPNNLFAAKAANLCQNVRNIQQILRIIQPIVRMPQCKGKFEHVLS